MEHFEKGHIYDYENIENILNNTFDYVLEDLGKDLDKLDDEILKGVLGLHQMMILTAYKVALLKGVNEDNE